MTVFVGEIGEGACERTGRCRGEKLPRGMEEAKGRKKLLLLFARGGGAGVEQRVQSDMRRGAPLPRPGEAAANHEQEQEQRSRVTREAPTDGQLIHENTSASLGPV